MSCNTNITYTLKKQNVCVCCTIRVETNDFLRRFRRKNIPNAHRSVPRTGSEESVSCEREVETADRSLVPTKNLKNCIKNNSNNFKK